MAKYLDPKNDLTFKRVFGEHKNLCISLINSMLPFEEGREVVSIEYETGELIPERQYSKNTIVDVRCKDNYGRSFIVEMQMMWSADFMQRVLFNASKVYVRQLVIAEAYAKLKPVYSINFLYDYLDLSPEMQGEYFHHYQIVNVLNTEQRIDGLEFVFVALKNFHPQNRAEKKLHELWLRFLTEINLNTKEAPAELLECPETCEALKYMEISAYSDAEMNVYERNLDALRKERSILEYNLAKGLEQGLAQGEQERMQLQQTIEYKDRMIENKDKVIEDKDRMIEDKDKLIEELKRLLIRENEV